MRCGSRGANRSGPSRIKSSASWLPTQRHPSATLRASPQAPRACADRRPTAPVRAIGHARRAAERAQGRRADRGQRPGAAQSLFRDEILPERRHEPAQIDAPARRCRKMRTPLGSRSPKCTTGTCARCVSNRATVAVSQPATCAKSQPSSAGRSQNGPRFSMSSTARTGPSRANPPVSARSGNDTSPSTAAMAVRSSAPRGVRAVRPAGGRIRTEPSWVAARSPSAARRPPVSGAFECGAASAAAVRRLSRAGSLPQPRAHAAHPRARSSPPASAAGHARSARRAPPPSPARPARGARRARRAGPRDRPSSSRRPVRVVQGSSASASQVAAWARRRFRVPRTSSSSSASRSSRGPPHHASALVRRPLTSTSSRPSGVGCRTRR